MKVIVFDFDGVIADSTYEVFILSQMTWEFFYSSLSPSVESILISFHSWLSSSSKKGDYNITFSRYRKYVRWPREYYLILKTMTENTEKDLTQIDFDGFVNNIPNEAMLFEKQFFDIRKCLQENCYDQWIKLFKPYDNILASLSSVILNNRFYILTGRDKESVFYFLEANGVILEKEKILDLKQFNKKSLGIEYILQKEKISPLELYFLDDNIKHLEEVFHLNIRLFWAQWGYICEEHYESKFCRNVQYCYLHDVNFVF